MLDHSATALRFTSAKRTSSSTWSAVGIDRLSITTAPLPLAISTARVAALASRTWPESVTVLPDADTTTFSPGSTSLR